jgi:glycosyltransferase involved in cell wall biosynthesis
MKVLLAHNAYQQAGGEDRVFAAEARSLESHGCQVVRYQVSNDEIVGWRRPAAAALAVWNPTSYAHMRRVIRAERPDVVHAHNTFPLISPALYYAARREGVPVVQTLHNYRMMCPSAILFRENRVCTKCVGKAFAWPGVQHGCYRGARSATLATAVMTAAHRAAGTWSRAVDLFIALTEFQRSLYIRAGVPGERIVVKPNFVDPDPGIAGSKRDHFLFAGRLTEEKGIRTLLRAWDIVGNQAPLHIAGDGPLAEEVAEAARRNPAVKWLRWMEPYALRTEMQQAVAVIAPSTWYEAAPLTIIEAYACGTPVIGSDLGGLATMIAHKRTGLHFPVGDHEALADRVMLMIRQPEPARGMARASRMEFESHYTVAQHHRATMALYRSVLSGKSDREPRPVAFAAQDLGLSHAPDREAPL